MKRLALFVCLLSAYAFGQGGAVTSVPTITNTRGEPVPYAQVAVCSANPGPAPTTICAGSMATVYVDITLGSACTTNATPIGPISGAGCTNPGKSDGLGNVVAFAPAGQYWCEYYGGSITRPLVVPCFFASGGGGGTISCSIAVNGAIGYFTTPASFTCDPTFITDGVGNWTAQSGRTLGPVNGMLGVIGGGTSPGAFPKYKLGAHEFRWLGANLITSYYMCPPLTIGTIGQTVQLTSQSTDGNGDIVDCLSWLDNAHGISFTVYNSSGLGAGTTTASTAYLTIPFACTIKAYNLLIDTGTITVKFWKVATGTAIPTSGNSINTSGVSISSGTAIHSTTLTDFTTTAVSANDIMAMNITAVTGATYVNGVLQCQ